MRAMLPILVVFTLLMNAGAARAQSSSASEAALKARIDSARVRLLSLHPGLEPNELHQSAEEIGRSNRLAQLIIQSIQRGNLDEADTLLKEFPGTVNDLHMGSQPLLTQAVHGGDEARVAWLLERKADPDGIGSGYADPPLIAAIQFRRWNIAERLLEAGASPNHTNRFGQTAGCTLLQNWSPSWFQPQTNVSTLLNRMLDAGLDPFTPCGRELAADSLIENCLSREQNSLSFPSPPNIPPPILLGDLLLTNQPGAMRHTPKGETALHLAVRYWRTNALDWLLTNGFTINQTNGDGLSPLQWLLGTGGAGKQETRPIRFTPVQGGTLGGTRPQPALRPPTLADLLIARGAALNVFCLAGLHDTNGLAALLLEDPAQASASDAFGRTPLHYALANATHIAYRTLATANGQIFMTGTVINVQRPGGSTVGGADPAVMETLRLLVAAGANVSAPTSREVDGTMSSMGLPRATTPLHLAVMKGSEDATRALLDAGAVLDTENADGHSPFHVAAQHAGTNVLELLLDSGAGIDTTNGWGRSPPVAGG